MNTGTVVRTLSGDQVVELVKVIFTGAVVLALAYGAYKSNCTVEVSKGDVGVKFKPGT